MQNEEHPVTTPQKGSIESELDAIRVTIEGSFPFQDAYIKDAIERASLDVFDDETREQARKALEPLQSVRIDSEKWRKLATEPFLKMQRMLMDVTKTRTKKAFEAEQALQQKIRIFDQEVKDKEARLARELDERYKERCVHLETKFGMTLDTSQSPIQWILPGTAVSINDAFIRVASREDLIAVLRTEVIPAHQQLKATKEVKQKLVSSEELAHKVRLLQAAGATKGSNGWWMLNGMGVHDENLPTTSIQEINEFLNDAKSKTQEARSREIVSKLDVVRNEQEHEVQLSPVEKTDPEILEDVMNRIGPILDLIDLLSSDIGKHAIPHIKKQLENTLYITRETIKDIKGKSIIPRP